MSNKTAIWIAVIFAVTYLFANRYELVPAGSHAIAWKIDTWTGNVMRCPAAAECRY